MKVIIYMASTMNGCIARSNDDTQFVSHASWESFDRMSKKAGNIILGYTTYRVSRADGTFPYPDRYNIIVTEKHDREEWKDNVAFVTSPKEALKMLEVNGFSTAFIGGGGSINGSFIAQGLVDEIIIDIEPVAFGKGKMLFGVGDFDVVLELKKIKKLSRNEIQLHYSVKK